MTCQGCDTEGRSLNRSGYCWRCRHSNTCPVCQLFIPGNGRGWCDGCKALQAQIMEAHDDRMHGPHLSHPDVEARIEQYAARARAKRPLFRGRRVEVVE